MLEPLQKLVRLSPSIAASLAVPEIFTRTEQKLGNKDAVTRLNLLRILRTICDAKEEGCWLIRAFGCYERITWLMDHDSAVLVRQMAEELVRACDEVEINGMGSGMSGKRSLSRTTAMSNLRRPASSAGRRDGSGSSSGSTLVSSGLGLTTPTPKSLKNTFLIPSMAQTPGRERIARSQSSTAMWDLAEDPSVTPTSSGKQRVVPLNRSSTSFAALQPGTPTHTRPSSARPASRDATSGIARLEVSSKFSSAERSRLPKARQGRLNDAITRRRQSNVNVGMENETPMGTPLPPGTPPLPRLQIVRRRRDTSGGEIPMRRGSTQE